MRERLRDGTLIALALLTFLAPLKFNLPVIFYRKENWPSTLAEWVFMAWPNLLFYGVWLLVLFMGWSTFHRADWQGKWMRWAWIFAGGQVLATLASTDSVMSWFVLLLIFSLVSGFWFGGVLIDSSKKRDWMLLAWTLASLMVVWKGVSDATGGLEATRQYLRDHPEIAAENPGLWHKVESDRIFSTFVYPNALGGYLISAGFMVVAWAWARAQGSRRAPVVRYGVATTVLILLGYCLWKSGSKGSYAVLVITLAIALSLRVVQMKKVVMFLTILLLLSSVFFAVGYGRTAVEKGKKTLEARLDYWNAAARIGWDHIFFGTGPGTFGVWYGKYKPREAEASQLAHNTYLQMWSDSGIVGFVTFILFLPVALGKNALRCMRLGSFSDACIWCACVAFAIHSLVDFDFYMVGNAWPVFVMLGYLCRRSHAPLANA